VVKLFNCQRTVTKWLSYDVTRLKEQSKVAQLCVKTKRTAEKWQNQVARL